MELGPTIQNLPGALQPTDANFLQGGAQHSSWARHTGVVELLKDVLREPKISTLVTPETPAPRNPTAESL